MEIEEVKQNEKVSNSTPMILIDKNDDNAELSTILSKIHFIRGQKVMLDFDLAEKYEIETAQLKRQVRRNIERFDGEDFMFELTKDEVNECSRCQIGTLNGGRGSNIKYSPFAFTELGVAMLSSVLNSEKAIAVNKGIMRAFVAIRRYVLNYAEIRQDLDKFVNETGLKFEANEMKFEALFNLFDEYLKQNKLYKECGQIGFKQNREIK